MSKIKIGDKFERLTVIDLIPHKNGTNTAICECICGNVIKIAPYKLLEKSTKSCGCLARELNKGRYSKDLTGRRFGRLLVIKCVGKMNDTKTWLCKCDCGNETVVTSSALTQNHTRSCGCLHRDIVKKQGIKHSMSNTKFYKVYTNILQRCNNENNTEYHNYGGRGIKCEWTSFENFKKDMYQSYLEHIEKYGEKDTTIDRIDVNGNYTKENCKWATWEEQANNKRQNHYIRFNDEIMTVKQVSKFVNIPYQTMIDRLNNGKDIYGGKEVDNQ